jgi:hypothetical protein
MGEERATGELDLESVKRLTRDMANAAASLSVVEVRYLVDAYYQMQQNRIVSGNQIRSLAEAKEPHEVLTWLADQSNTLEGQIRRTLDRWTSEDDVAYWCKQIVGIGPVIAAGLRANIDIEKAPTAGHIWRFAGLDPTSKWLPKTKRPWNAGLKTLCWKLGESFVKVMNHEDDQYGKIYISRKAFESAKNEAGEYAEQAKVILATKKIDKATDAYKAYSQGKLPPGHLHSRAKRYAVKIFLSHLHEYWYKQHFKKDPPAPFAIAILGHAHKIDHKPVRERA